MNNLTLQSLFRYFQSHPESSWLMEYPNCVKLYEFIVKHPIKRVLDLGTGIGLSSAVVGLAFKDKGDKDFKIDSVEQFDKCVKIANELIPKELKENLTIHKSEAVLWQDDNVPYQYFSVYNTLPEGDYDLIVNDGPSFWEADGKMLDFPNGTITKMLKEGKLKKEAYIVFDGRITSLKLLERYYSDNFWMYQLAPKGRDFNVLQVKDEVPKFSDYMLEAMKATTFFKDYAKDIVSKHEPVKSE